jgi:C4-dicarboxylate transporter DctM subunit
MSPVLLVIVVQILFFVLGMFIDPMSLILICLPLFLPALKAADVDLLWLGIVVSISCMIANLTPPVGFNLFIVQGAGAAHGLKFTEVVRGAIPFILLLIIGMALVIAFPSLATWLPSTMD